MTCPTTHKHTQLPGEFFAIGWVVIGKILNVDMYGEKKVFLFNNITRFIQNSSIKIHCANETHGTTMQIHLL